MNRQQILQFKVSLKQLLQRLKIVNLSLITVVIILYSTAVFCLLKEQMVAAFSLATFAAVIFHLSQKYIVSIIKYCLYSKRKKESEEMFTFIETGIEKKKIKQKEFGLKKNSEIKEFFTLLEKAIKIIENKP